MEEYAKLIESLLEKATEYGKSSLELVKLKALDKTTDLISSFIPHAVVFIIIASSLIFINLGLAIWLGEILGKIWLGFFAVAAFYLISGICVHFFLHKKLKKDIGNYIIKQLFK